MLEPAAEPTTGGAERKRLRTVVREKAQRHWEKAQRYWEKLVKRVLKLSMLQGIVAVLALLFIVVTVAALGHATYDVLLGTGASIIARTHADNLIQQESCRKMSTGSHLSQACVIAANGLSAGWFSARFAMGLQTIKLYWSGFVPDFVLNAGILGIVPYACTILWTAFKIFFTSVTDPLERRSAEDARRDFELRVRASEADAAAQRRARLDREAEIVLAHGGSGAVARSNDRSDDDDGGGNSVVAGEWDGQTFVPGEQQTFAVVGKLTSSQFDELRSRFQAPPRGVVCHGAISGTFSDV